MNKEIIKLDITGMTCDHCATGIEKLLCLFLETHRMRDIAVSEQL